MREKVKDRGRLEHILEAINEIQEYKSQYTLEDVKNSKLVFYAFRAKAPLADQNSGRAIASPATSLALMLRVSVPYKGNRRGRKDY